MHALTQDLRLALRRFRRELLLSLSIVLTLGLAIGAGTTVFGVVYEVLVRPLPYAAPEQLVRVSQAGAQRDRGWGLTTPALRAWCEGARGVLQGLEGMAFQDTTLAGDGPAQPVRVARATPGLLPLLGVRPLLGAGFGADAATPGHDAQLLLSHATWQGRFGGDVGVLGRTLTLGGVPHTIVGVLPADFPFEPTVELWKPLAPRAGAEADAHDHHFMRGVGRLRPGVGVQAAHAELERLAADFVPHGGPPGARVEPLHALLVKNVRTQLWLLAGVAALILLVACANVANLLLARATARARELSVRVALGATRLQLVRQLLAETLVLAAAGGALGVLLAAWGRGLLHSFVPVEVALSDDSGLSASHVAIGAGLAALACLLAGGVPALRASRASGGGLLGRMAGAGFSGGGGRLRALLVVAQVALAVAPLAGAGLLLRTLRALDAVPLGFEPRGVLLADVLLEADAFPGPAYDAAVTDILARVQGLPGVEAAGVASTVPLLDRNGFAPVLRPGEDGADWRTREPVNFRAVSEGYLAALRLPLREGRWVTAGDGAEAPPVVVVNQAFVRRHFPGGDSVLGQRVQLAVDGEPLREIVGVVGDVRHTGLAEEPPPEVYVPYGQLRIRRLALVVRSGLAPEALVPLLRAQVHAARPGLALLKVRTLEDLVAASFVRTRVLGGLFAVLAGLGLALAAVGLYGVLAYGVSQRRRELGIRAALGAQGAQLVALVLRQGARLTAVGLALGLAGAAALARTLGGVVYGVGVLDPVTFVGVPVVLGAVALVASWVPARRVLRVPPQEALRAE